MKVNSAWITSMAKASCSCPMGKCLRDISRRTWLMVRVFCAGIMARGLEAYGGRTSCLECTERTMNNS